MKKIGFIGTYDKSDLIIYIAKILKLLEYNVMVVDSSLLQKMKYIVPSINPTKSYITDFEDIDFAIGFESWEEIEKYLGIKFDSSEDLENPVKDNKGQYDYVLLDIDSPEKLESFDIENADKNYFVTAFDTYSLKKGIKALENLKVPMSLTKVLFSYEPSKEDEEYLNFISLEYKINWNDFIIYFPIFNEDSKVIQENQRLEKIRFRRLSNNYKESLAYIVQDINSGENLGKIKRIMKD